MIINRQNLDALRAGFKTTFQNQLKQTTTLYGRIATTVPSTAGEEKYGWLGKIPSVREWLGERIIQNLMEHDYAIKNRDFELTIGVDRNNIEDDTLGIYTPIFQMFGESVAAWPDQLVFALLPGGFTTTCYDGQYFFDTDHPVIDADGVTVNSVANTDGGAGTPWYLLYVSNVLKPIIWQLRKPGQFVPMDRVDDENVFYKKEFRYGWDGRGNAGYGLWQFAWGSKQTLDAAHFETALAALQGMKGDHGRPIGPSGTPLLVVPPSLRVSATAIVQSQLVNGGETNPNAGAAEVFVVPWLA